MAELKVLQHDNTVELEAAREAFTQEVLAASDVPNHQAIIDQAVTDGVMQALAEREAFNERVAALDARLKELSLLQRRLEDEYANTKCELMETAPVIACTLTALTIKSELSTRRFDTVIIDEAASAQVPHLVYAGSKADRCLAYVGDFLQNAPISDTDDAVTEEQQQLLAWQRDDIFSLVGIHNRYTAEAHPRCVALRTQFRYPPVIADIVNEFCYAGLLQTHWTGTVDGPIVIFVDTSGHPEQGLRRDGTSSTHPLGLRIMTVLYERRDQSHSIGLVCPYTSHGRRAEALARDRGFDLPCGTAHKFQGRQFDTVILDLVQDAEYARWAARADLAGSRREISGPNCKCRHHPCQAEAVYHRRLALRSPHRYPRDDSDRAAIQPT